MKSMPPRRRKNTEAMHRYLERTAHLLETSNPLGILVAHAGSPKDRERKVQQTLKAWTAYRLSVQEMERASPINTPERKKWAEIREKVDSVLSELRAFSGQTS